MAEFKILLSELHNVDYESLLDYVHFSENSENWIVWDDAGYVMGFTNNNKHQLKKWFSKLDYLDIDWSD